MKQPANYRLIFLIGALQLLFQLNCSGTQSNDQLEVRVKWDGQYIQSILRVSGLGRTTEVVTHRQGGDPFASIKSPGLTSYEPIVIERERTQDTAFEEWANKIIGPGSNVPISDFRKDIILELYEANQLVIAYDVFRCWPSEYVAFTEADINGHRVTIESITIENEGWARDTSRP